MAPHVAAQHIPCLHGLCGSLVSHLMCVIYWHHALAVLYDKRHDQLFYFYFSFTQKSDSDLLITLYYNLAVVLVEIVW